MTQNPEIWTIRHRVQEFLYQMAENEINGVVSTYPNSGKTYGAIKVFQDPDHKGTLLQPNRDLRDETRELAEEQLGIDVLDLPSFPNDSPLMDPDSQWYNERVEDWYRRGMPPRDIYRIVEAPDEDPYKEVMKESYTAYDLVLGDPVHAFLEKVDRDRTVIFDDVNLYGSFVTKYDFSDEAVLAEVKEYLSFFKTELGYMADKHGIGQRLPQSLTEIFRSSDDMRAAIHEFVTENESRQIISKTKFVKASTSRFLRVITAKNSWDSAIEWTDTDPCIKNGVKIRGVFVQEDDSAVIGQFPLNLAEARNIIMLGATPIYPVIRQLFESIGRGAVHEDPITDEEKQLYFDSYLNMKIIQTTDFLRPASGNNSVKLKRLRELVESYRHTYGRPPLIISSKKFLEAHESWLDKHNLDSIHFAKAIGTNEFGAVTDCIVFGCPHYGDDYVRRMAAFCEDFDAEPIREDGKPTRWSTDTSQEIYDNMTAGSVFQALMRVGRSTEERTRVWIESSAIPDYVPRVKHIVRGTSDSEHEILTAIQSKNKTAKQISEEVNCSRSQIYRSLDRLADMGLIEIKGHGKSYAEIFGMVADAMDEGIVETVASSSNIIIQSCNTIHEIEAEIKESDDILVMQGGMIPERVDRQAVEKVIADRGLDIPLSAFG